VRGAQRRASIDGYLRLSTNYACVRKPIMLQKTERHTDSKMRSKGECSLEIQSGAREYDVLYTVLQAVNTV